MIDLVVVIHCEKWTENRHNNLFVGTVRSLSSKAVEVLASDEGLTWATDPRLAAAACARSDTSPISASRDGDT